MLVLVKRVCRIVVTTLDLSQGPLLGLLLGYSHLEVAWGPSSFAAFHLSVVSLVEGRSC